MRRLESKALIEMRMTENNHDLAGSPRTLLETGLDKPRADSLPLELREDGHRPEAERRHFRAWYIDLYGTKKNVADKSGICRRNEGDKRPTGLPEGFNDSRFVGAAERLIVDVSDGSMIRRCFTPYDHHTRSNLTGGL